MEVPEQEGKTAQVTSAAQECISKLRSEFQTKMSDDLNTAQILTVAFQEALKFINSSLNMLKVHILNQFQQGYDVLGLYFSLFYALHVKWLWDLIHFDIFQKKQQQLSMIQSLIEVEKEVKEVLNILGLLSSSTYLEVI